MEQIKLTVETREGAGTKKQLSSMRGALKIPGVIYGGDKPTVQVALVEKELLAARKKGGVNAILTLDVGGKGETVIVKALQRHPVTDRLVHADFQRISLTEKIEARVPLHIIGEAPGVKTSGGLLQYELRELRVRALPADIPQAFDVDVSHLELNQHILVKDINVGKDVEVIDAADHMVLHVALVKEEVVEAPVAAVAAEGVVAAEPEVASMKGKKDEEGKLVKEQAKAAAPAAGEKEKAKEPGKKEGK